MKKVLLVLGMVALTFGMNAQKLSIDRTDEFTGSVIKATKYYNLAKTSVGTLKAKVTRVDDSTFLRVYSTSDLGCSGARGNSIIFLNADGSKVELKDEADISCSDYASSMFVISNLDLSCWTKVRFEQSEYYTDGVAYGTYSLEQLIQATK